MDGTVTDSAVRDGSVRGGASGTAVVAAPRTPAPRTPSRYLARTPVPGRLRLFCFHHAGGTTAAFAHWRETLGPDITVLPVRLPGRESRVREPRVTDLAALTRDLDLELDPLLDEPYAFYGHSMGALIAYSLTRLRALRGASLPVRLMVGAYPGPHLKPPTEAVRTLPDPELGRWLVDHGGLSPVLLQYPNWLSSATALLRDDLMLCHSYRHADGEPLPCPIDVFTGAADPLMTGELAAAWRGHTRAGFRVHVVPGGHLFVLEPEAGLPGVLARLLASTGAAHDHLEG
jgi:surfactin synthase thioesterase subunit